MAKRARDKQQRTDAEVEEFRRSLLKSFDRAVQRAEATEFYNKLYTKYGADDLLDLTPASQKEYLTAHACPACHGASAAWRANPVAFDIEIERSPGGPIAVVRRGCFASVMRSDLADALKPYLPEPLFGRVSVLKPKPSDSPGRWVTCVPGEGRGVQTERGEFCRHGICAGGCGAIRLLVTSVRGGVVQRSVGDRLAFFGDEHFYDVFVTDALIAKLDLKKRFRDLRFYQYDILDEPEDGEVLPGDPGWDGVFRGPRMFEPLRLPAPCRRPVA